MKINNNLHIQLLHVKTTFDARAKIHLPTWWDLVNQMKPKNSIMCTAKNG